MAVSDITSPVVLLTGPTSGIGAAMLNHLKSHPTRPVILLLSRDGPALKEAAAKVRSAGLTARSIPVDLADFDSVRRATDQVAALVRSGGIPPIDAAILNAGTQFSDRRHTGAQGYELTFTINVIAQHLLLLGLQPLLAAAGHTVLLGSTTHRGKRESFNLVPDPHWQKPHLMATATQPSAEDTRPSLEREQGGVAYATSKLALVTLSHVWAARLAKEGQRLNTYDPGLVPGTGLGKDMPGYRYWVWKHLMPAMSILPGAARPMTTARHAVALALSDAHATVSGGYLEIGRLAQAASTTLYASRQQDLWDWLSLAVAPYVEAPSER
ncbi:SDR family NAD(P)-dependent oxidoreductase [Arthrobacter sp. HLT1-21]